MVIKGDVIVQYAVDRIEENKAILENIETKEKKEISLNLLPKVKEKDILSFEDGIYKVDDNTRKDRERLMREKLEKLKRK